MNQKRITNSKDLRKLRTILPDPVARAHFLSEEGDLESAQLRLRPAEKKDERRATDQPRNRGGGHEKRAVDRVAGDEGESRLLEKIDDAEELLKSLRKALKST